MDAIQYKKDKGNTLLAIFMGMAYNNKKLYSGWYKNNMRICDRTALKYQTSWDWLMPVLDKIESLGYYTEINKKINGNSHIHIHDPNVRLYDFHISISDKKKIKAIWLACVTFVDWYNKQNLN